MTKTRFKVSKEELIQKGLADSRFLSSLPEFIALEGEIVEETKCLIPCKHSKETNCLCSCHKSEEELPKRIDLGVWSTCVSCHSQLCSCPERQPDKTWKKRPTATPTKKIEKLIYPDITELTNHKFFDKINEIINHINYE